MSQNGFYLTQMESARTFLLNIKGKDLKMGENEFNEKKEKCLKKYEEIENNKNLNKNTKPN